MFAGVSIAHHIRAFNALSHAELRHGRQGSQRQIGILLHTAQKTLVTVDDEAVHALGAVAEIWLNHNMLGRLGVDVAKRNQIQPALLSASAFERVRAARSAGIAPDGKAVFRSSAGLAHTL